MRGLLWDLLFTNALWDLLSCTQCCVTQKGSVCYCCTTKTVLKKTAQISYAKEYCNMHKDAQKIAMHIMHLSIYIYCVVLYCDVLVLAVSGHNKRSLTLSAIPDPNSHTKEGLERGSAFIGPCRNGHLTFVRRVIKMQIILRN